MTEAGLWVLTALDGGQARLQARGAPYAPVDLTYLTLTDTSSTY